MDVTPYIVGIGGSAGGVQAFSDLFSYLPPDTGMTFVIVHHAGSGSRMDEVLARVTKMPVSQVKVATDAAPDNVYVIAHGTNLSFKDHALCPSVRREEVPLRSVDFFFRSLANEKGSRAIAIVMSGALSDGSEGIKSIRAAHGITMTQDIQSAQQNDMPRHAIATGCVDFIGTPREIANELSRIARNATQAP